jgi:alpha-1,6-mannosyltransferase
MALRIAQLANFVGPTSGGMRVAIEQLGLGYLTHGHERLLLIPGPKNRITESESGILVEVASPKVNDVYRMVLNTGFALRLLNRFNPTSVECADKWTLAPVARWAARRPHCGSVLFSHERLDDMFTGFVRNRINMAKPVHLYNRFLADRFDRVIVTSQYSAGEWKYTNANLELVPLGVDLDFFTPGLGSRGGGFRQAQPASEFEDADGTAQSGFAVNTNTVVEEREARLETTSPARIVYVGRMSHEKDPQLGVAAAVELYRRGVPFELHMFGTGPDEQELKRLAGEAPVFFHGFVPREQVVTAFQGADISFSISPNETFGLSVLEALACGTPVVTANRGGASEVVTPECSQLAVPTPEGIANATQALIPRLGSKMRAAARSQAEKFPWDKAVTRMLQIHEEV